jgi:cytochrome P450
MGLIRAINIYLIHNANVGIYSEWHPIVSYIKYLLGVPGIEYIFDFCQHQIDERFDAIKTATGYNDGDGDFLGKLLNMHLQAPDKFTMYHILMTCAANIGAGSDTTSITMTAIMYYLMQNPEMYKKVSPVLGYYNLLNYLPSFFCLDLTSLS